MRPCLTHPQSDPPPCGYFDWREARQHEGAALQGDERNSNLASAFAFDPERKGTILVAADKQGKDQVLFYMKLIKTADKRFDDHLAKLAKKKAASLPVGSGARRKSKE